MAEVKVTKPNMIPVSYVDNVVLTSATITPPSMTYIDSSTQVTAKPGAVYFSYQIGEEVTLDTKPTRIIHQTVELNSRLTRAVETNDPFRVGLNSTTTRNILNSVELESTLSREIISYNIRLDYFTRRVVTNDITLESNIFRNCEIDLKLKSKLKRNVISDDDDHQEEIHKEYGSFVSKNKLYRVQHDVLDEDVSDNPYFNRSIANIDNAVLLTHNQTVIKAINEIFVNQRELFFNTLNSIKKFNNTIGDIVLDKNLKEEYKKLNSESIIDALVKISKNFNDISIFVGYETGSDGETLIEIINRISQQINEMAVKWQDIEEEDIEWIFRISQTIPEFEDRIIGLMTELRNEFNTFSSNIENRYEQFSNEINNTIVQNYNGLLEKVNTVSHRVDILENSRRALNRKIDTLADQIILAFRRYTDITEADIRAILAALEHIDAENPDAPEDISQETYNRLVNYINDKISEVNQTIEGLDNRVTELEFKFATTFTSDDLASEEDINNMFNGITYHGDPITANELEDHINDMSITPEDINNLFTVTLDDGREVTVQELLDMVASGADIQDLFADEEQIESMRELLKKIAVYSQEISANENNG